MRTGFVAGEEQWRNRLGTLRQVVRQELVARQLETHLPGVAPRRVLDVGCGQGTQVIRLARLGHHVTGLDSSPTLLADLVSSLRAEGPEVRERVQVVQGAAEELATLFRSASFDAVLCHGVLMYFSDPNPLLSAIAQVVALEGIVSLLVRNGDALALRPGLMGDWTTASKAFDEMTYDNRIGVTARADCLSDLTARLAQRSLDVRVWYGVRVFTDTVASDTAVPDNQHLAELLACEERAGCTDPYRRVAALTHVIAGRTSDARDHLH